MAKSTVCLDRSRDRMPGREVTTMKRVLIVSLLAAAVIVLTSLSAAAQSAGPVPRLADGHPDLSGVWWGGSDVGAARGGGAGGARRGGGGGGAAGARGAGGARGTPAPTY